VSRSPIVFGEYDISSRIHVIHALGTFRSKSSKLVSSRFLPPATRKPMAHSSEMRYASTVFGDMPRTRGHQP